VLDLVPHQRWPEMPYKGFSYYGPDDVPLFAGRDQQIVDFARLVGQRETRLVLLQGATGCGKSSFLRAGLIPYLEGRLRGFEFLKETQGDPDRAIFIRSTDSPLEQLAEEIFRIASEGYAFTSPVGREHLELREALCGVDNADQLAEVVVNDPAKLVEALRIIAGLLPVTMVLIVDQGEEALSLSGAREIDNVQAAYFRFLGLFAASKFPLKLIISLRTDYFGLFLDAIDDQSAQKVELIRYRLKNISQQDLVIAIKRPTRDEAVIGYGAPPYGFKFEDGLPEIIVEDLISKSKAGGLLNGELPVLQVVCETLYLNTQQRKIPWIITLADYASLGEIETQLNDYVDRVLISFCKTKEIPMSQYANEVIDWKDSLTQLAKMQANNSVTTDLKAMGDLIKAAKNPTRHFGDLLTYLSRDDVGVLREELVRKLGSKEEVRSFSLRHDAVGLVLVRWKAAREASRGTLASWSLFVRIAATVYFVTGVSAMVAAWIQGFDKDTIPLLILGASCSLAGIFIPYYVNRTFRRVPLEFLGFQLQLMRNPVFGISARSSRAPLDEESLAVLERNPIFRLYERTAPNAKRLLREARLRIEKKLLDKHGGSR
jgi:hypothetical protein